MKPPLYRKVSGGERHLDPELLAKAQAIAGNPAEGIEIDPDEIWGDVRDRSLGREINL